MKSQEARWLISCCYWASGFLVGVGATALLDALVSR